MHQIISGETLNKTKVFDHDTFKDFLVAQRKIFAQFKSICLYESKDFLQSQSMNYFNAPEEKKEYHVLKQLLKKEYHDLENLYPYLGDIFLSEVLGNIATKNKYKTFKFKKNHKNKVINNLNFDINKQILSLFFNNFSLEYFIKVDFRKNLNKIILIKEDKNYFNLFFEKEYYEKEEVVFNYKVIVLDGVIQSVGEIHHILQESAENKTPFIIFCYGTSEEVKHNIITNNKRGITRIYPICFNFDEDSLNVLNDIAIMHDCEIISANKGQSIATEIKNLRIKGDKISISKNGFSFTPVCEKSQLESHKNFLNERIKNARADSNKDVIINRYKRLFSKSAKIVLPEELKLNSSFMREFDYIFKFMSNLDKNIAVVRQIKNKKDLYIPLHFLKIMKNKNNSLKNTFRNIQKIILSE